MLFGLPVGLLARASGRGINLIQLRPTLFAYPPACSGVLYSASWHLAM